MNKHTASASKLGSDWHRVGLGLSVRFSVNGATVNAEWHPKLPTPREWRCTRDAYRRARDQFMGELSRQLRRAVLVIEQ